MDRTITIGRWRLELHQRAVHLCRGPNPHCPNCLGYGGIEVGGAVGDNGEVTVDPETELCHCWNPAAGLRIPLWRRRPVDYATEAPF